MQRTEFEGSYIEFQVGKLVVSGKGVPSASCYFNNKIGKASVGVIVPLSDDVERWVVETARNQEVGYNHDFRLVMESEDKTAQLIINGNGSVHPHLSGRYGFASITIVDIPHLYKKAVDLMSQ